MMVMTAGRGAGKLAAMAEEAGEAGVRELVAGWLAAERPDGDGRGEGGPGDDGRGEVDGQGQDGRGQDGRGEGGGRGDVGRGEAERVGGGWAVPPAEAAVVVAAARRLAGGEPGRSGARPAVPDGLRMIAEALVVDEHPSAAAWTATERAEAVGWVALLLHRFGEDGVTLLTAELVKGAVREAR